METNTRRFDDNRQGARATDDDRQHVANTLNSALARGSLEAAEHQQRVVRAWEARYTAQLTALTRDLPGPAEADVARAQRDSDTREWLDEWRWWLGGAVIMSAIWGVQAIRSGAGFYWPLIPLGIWAAVLLAVAIWPARGDS